MWSHARQLCDKFELLLVRVALCDCAKVSTVHTLIRGHQVGQKRDGIDNGIPEAGADGGCW